MRSILLKLKGIVTRDDAVDRAGQLNHPCLVLDICRMVGRTKGVTGHVRFHIPVEVGIVGGENEARGAFDQ